MLKGKNLYYVLGLGAVAYYFFYMNKKKKAMSAPSTAPANFTGDLSVFDYQNARGSRYVRPTMNFNRQAGSYNDSLAYGPTN